jgi:hypothetical protein
MDGRDFMRGDKRDIGAGMLFVLAGGFFCFYALVNLRLGTAFRMGPGFFPVLVGAILLLLGVATLVRGLLSGPAQLHGTTSWRAVILITAAPVAFGLALPRLGFLAALALAVGLAAFASVRMNLRMAAAVVVALTAFSALVFSWGLGLPLRLVGPWLDW